ncbi:MAG: hypothetical protein IJP13_05155 [Lachnospiraceae bacterium]|nr:hypothetical protein [Lachnospiraceae bacterium]
MEKDSRYEELKNNPALKDISEAKLELLISLVTKAETLKQNELMPFFLSITKQASDKGMSFNDAETEIILNVLKKKMSPADIKKIDMIRNLSRMISLKASKK